MGASSNLGSNLASEVKSRTGWGIFLGILTVLLGILLIVFPLFAATVTTIIIGAFLVIAGVFELVQALRAHTVGTFFLRLLLGIVYGIGGLMLLSHPLWGVAVLTVVLGVMLLFEAGVTTVLGFQIRPASGWGWLIFDAVITAILGILILAHWPASAIWALGTLVGAAVLLRGITRIGLSSGLRRAAGRLADRDIQGPRAA
jgi:uncharacterized membrane protein HdeD (DUF308 family)